MRLASTFFIAATLGSAFLADAQQVTGTPAAAPAPALAGDVRATLGSLAQLLDDNFVLPEKGKAYAAMLRANLAAGSYASTESAADLARAVTADLQAVYPDRHLRLFAPRPAGGGGARVSPSGEPAILRSGWAAPGVAYIAFSFFPGDDATVADVKAFLADHRDARALIIDARGHHGGDRPEMDALFAQLFVRETELVRMDTRAAVDQREGGDDDTSTVRRIAGPEGVIRRAHYAEPEARQGALARAKVYLLTSHATASSAEHMALALKRTGRATLIGETTAGAGNYGRFFDLPGGYRVFVPFGRTFDPTTGAGWEGVGIQPDVAIAADRALDEALRRAGVNTPAAQMLAAL